MKIRADIAERLRQGLTVHQVAAECHASHHTVTKARNALRLPPCKQGRRPAAGTIEDAFHARTEPVDGGHLKWTGHVDRSGTPIVSHRRVYQTANRVAFRIRHGREPIGKALPSCDYPGCVAPDHIDDQPMREHNRATYHALFGGDQ
ncbi:helix-turn-helix domain-containing protein [Streptomyces sp. A3M-1-3]|uniref:helix-turn-helix domain-containing protein n=1 Tax=Streptomyces sp. A3M-1-3 TaxID=2962044 RepID=UPI0020B78D66|nr:helix-turn-helix domain-containing protein [Streptomyces sp. A3M-1-3]MCP3817803.1 helix-turn-helix domain-containing protein [Streptomyces sp. A3M-1-3]